MQLVYLVSSGIGIKKYKSPEKEDDNFLESIEDEAQLQSINKCGNSIVLNQTFVPSENEASWTWGRYTLLQDYHSARALAKDVIDSQKQLYENLTEEENSKNRKLHKVVGDLLKTSDEKVTMEGFPNRSWIGTVFETQDWKDEADDKVMIAYTVIVTELKI